MKKIVILAAVPVLVFFSCSKSSQNSMMPVPTAAVSTYAGNGTAGLQNGVALSAEFNLPVDIALDQHGNFFVAEQGNNLIRRIAPDGTVSTYAGDGKAGYKEGDAHSAEFNGPEGLVIDDVGNLYVSDSQNNVIRKISLTGTVSTYAGNGTQGLKNGSALSAEFSGPNGLAIDKSRNIYVADYFNNVIRQITPGGVVSTYAGNGTAGLVNGSAASAEFHAPSGLGIDASRNLYVAEAPNKTIRKIAASGGVSTYASGLSGPVRLVTDATGNLFVSDGNTIKKVSSDGTVSPYAGNGAPGFNDGKLPDAEFSSPSGVVSDPGGNLFIADNGNNRIRVITP